MQSTKASRLLHSHLPFLQHRPGHGSSRTAVLILGACLAVGLSSCRTIDQDWDQPVGEAFAPTNFYQRGPMPSSVRRVALLPLYSGEWDHVDLDGRRLVIPDSKSGAKTVPLSAPAAQVLDGLPQIDESPYVLPARRGKGHFVGVPHVWRRVRRRASLEDVRLHDLRHTYASVGAIGGESLIIIGALLGHSQPATTSRYAHLSDDPLQEAATRVSATIAAALAGDQSAGGEVVELREPFRRNQR